MLPLLSATVSLVTPSKPFYLGIDAGTQSTKAVVYDAAQKKIVGRGAVSYGLNPTDVIGRAEQDPAVWVDAMWRAGREALDVAGEGARAKVSGIGVSGQQHGLVPLDEDFSVIRPSKLCAAHPASRTAVPTAPCATRLSPTRQLVRGAEEAAELSKSLEVPIVASFTASKLNVRG